MESISSILNQYFRKVGIAKPVNRHKIFYEWSEVVGPKIASVSEPVRFSGGRLFVRVQSDVWRQELVFHKDELLRKIKKRIGDNSIQDIVLI